MNFSDAEIEAIVADALQREDQLLFHAAGDRPLKVVFDAMENHAETVDWPQQRVRIEHGDALTGDLIERARNLGVLLVQNPSHLASVELVAQRFGPESSFFRVRSLLEAGIPLALGSDGPLNPYLNLMFASLHPIAPAEALTREQVVIAYTRGSAFAEFKEEEKGTISPGKLADLAVLSQDIFTVPAEALPATQSLLTLVGGEIVYDAERLR